ncbi:hypothetical protein AVEN_151505-1 [Araneus ventricosus]|uniref:Uncharacterized protein n=1 Tax=Araneus ventricosus TaxID=182803 RepID=A0A4Y2IRW9_ARAVE|nr:hypothetical protein AVEN_151505-1 [Araneus ventricosus]
MGRMDGLSPKEDSCVSKKYGLCARESAPRRRIAGHKSVKGLMECSLLLVCRSQAFCQIENMQQIISQPCRMEAIAPLKKESSLLGDRPAKTTQHEFPYVLRPSKITP